MLRAARVVITMTQSSSMIVACVSVEIVMDATNIAIIMNTRLLGVERGVYRVELMTAPYATQHSLAWTSCLFVRDALPSTRATTLLVPMPSQHQRVHNIIRKSFYQFHPFY